MRAHLWRAGRRGGLRLRAPQVRGRAWDRTPARARRRYSNYKKINHIKTPLPPFPSRSNDFLITAAGDGSWAFYDVNAAACVTQVQDEAAGAAYSCAALHPDGLILCTGTEDAAVRIWETRTSKVG